MLTKEVYTVEELELAEEDIDELVENGMASRQMIDGEACLRIFPIFFSEGAELAVDYPESFCLELWNTLCEDSEQKLDPLSFVHIFTSVHRFVKEFTDGKVDFCEHIGNALDGVLK